MVILLPVLFVSLLVWIKEAVERSGENILADLVGSQIPADPFSILSFGDYVTAMQAKRQCVLERGRNATDGAIYRITGMRRYNKDWQVPFVKCDSRLCEYDGQNAVGFCEFGAVGLAPSAPDDHGGRQRAQDFEHWLYHRHPILQTKQGLPFDFDFVRHFDGPQDMNDYVKHRDYGGPENPKIIMGIVWEGNSTKDYRYSLRQNATNYNAPENEGQPATLTTPDTKRKFDDYANTDFEACAPEGGTPELGFFGFSCTGQYMYNGVLSMQRLVGDYILNRTGAADAGFFVDDAGIQFVNFPTKPYLEAGFYASIDGKILKPAISDCDSTGSPFSHVVFPLQWLVLYW